MKHAIDRINKKNTNKSLILSDKEAAEQKINKMKMRRERLKITEDE
jgi:hypothetical protein